MQTVFLLFLFILQVISFYIIALLYMKISKFNGLEKKQQKLMTEMDDAIGAYLSELKEENERLIEIIEKRQNNFPIHDQEEEVNPADVPAARKESKEKPITINHPSYPVNIALKSYQTASATKDTLQEASTDLEVDDRTLAIRMHDEGKSIEEIAKRVGKGKTEIELMLKFR